MTRTTLATMAVAALLGGCNMLGLGQSVSLTPETAAAFDNYLAQLGPVNHGYFAVSKDGTGYGFMLCGAEICEADALKTALDGCKIGSNGAECLIFAADREPQIEYEVSAP